MNRKRQQFVKEYMIDLNATQAAIRAGYSEKTAYSQGQRLLKNVEVEIYLNREMEKRSKATEISASYVLETIRETVERCRQAEPVIDKEGCRTGEYKFDAQAVMKGCELLGRHLALFVDRTEHSGKINVVTELTDADLERIAAGCGQGTTLPPSGTAQPA